jgi:hypothetical protein
MKKLVILILMLAALPAVAQQPSPCGQPEADQFDFWIETWDVEVKGPYEGSSFNWYDPAEEDSDQ